MKTLNKVWSNPPGMIFRPLVVVLAVGVVWLVPSNSYADPTSPTATKRRSRPKLPVTFDAATVQRLLDTIEVAHNADMLKLGYFYRRGTPVLPVTEGFKLLSNSLGEEQVGTLRWFNLQMVRGWATTHCPELSYDEGFEAYEAIFDNSDKARKQPALYMLHKSIREFVFSVQEHKQPKLSDHTKSVLISAWAAYVPDIGQKSAAGGSPSWSSVIRSLQLEDDFLPLVDSALENEQIPRSLELYRLAAILHRPADPDKAVQLLKKAKNVLPKDDPAQVQSYYELLVDWQTQVLSDKAGKEIPPQFDEAITSQREFIKASGSGRAELAQLYVKAGDSQGLAELVQALQSPTADETEVVTTGEALMQMYRGKDESRLQAAAQGRELLNTYLTVRRTRDPEKELFTRSILSAAYAALGEFPKAREILSSVDKIQLKEPSPRSQQLLDQISTQVIFLSKQEAAEVKSN